VIELQSKNIGKAVLAWLMLQAVHQLFNEAITVEARKRGWTPRQVEVAKLAVSGVMLFA
jgi:hypothetical protein